VLEGKVAIITGSGRGIGKAIALRFAAEGARIVVCDINIENAEAVSRAIGELGRASVAVKTDVSVKQDVENLVATGVQAFKKIDILVNNAGIMRRAQLLEMTEEDWDAVLDVCLKGVFLCTQAAAKHMVKQKSGRIINISSSAGLGTADEFMANYGAAKAGVIELTKATARALGRFGISVAAIAPGTTLTELERSRKTPEEYRDFIEQRGKITVLGRVGTVEDIAALATFLASDESSFITGAVIPIDGGRFDKL
jgi:3-oxoacyl-[acyl-carrier protein] reductase